MMKKKIAFVTLGCKLNYAETSTYERGLLESGRFEAVQWDERADMYLVNTCTVTEHSDKKCRNIIRKLHRISPEAEIIVTGCYAQMKKAEIEKIEGVRFVFGADEKNAVVPAVLRHLDGNDGPCGADPASFLPAYSSMPIRDIVAQAHEIAGKGIKEIVLTGVNTGDFGKTTGESFLDLIKALNEVEGIERYRISSIEPNLLTEETIDWIASGTKFLPHFHIPLQAGSDTILKEMGRRYDTASFEHKIGYIRQKMEKPGRAKVFFGIDVIVGFPGESDSLFAETCDFLENRIRPAFIHIFPYSRRKGTRADLMKNQIQDSVKTERVRILEGLCERLHSEFVLSNRGVPEKVLFESSDKDGKMFGYTGNYIRVERPFDPALTGKIVDIIL